MKNSKLEQKAKSLQGLSQEAKDVIYKLISEVENWESEYIDAVKEISNLYDEIKDLQREINNR